VHFLTENGHFVSLTPPEGGYRQRTLFTSGSLESLCRTSGA